MRKLAITLCAVAGFVATAPQVASADPCSSGQYWDGHNCVVKLNSPPQFRAKFNRPRILTPKFYVPPRVQGPKFYTPRVHTVKLHALPRPPGVKFKAAKVYTSNFNTPPQVKPKFVAGGFYAPKFYAPPKLRVKVKGHKHSYHDGH